MRIAVFPGSFDPITKAHCELIERGLGLFDQIIVAVGVNASKKGLLAREERLQLIRDVFPAKAEKVLVQSFTGLTVDFCKQVGAHYILRGIRNTQDFEFENAIAQNNKLLAPEIETYFLVSQAGMGHISSSIVRDVLQHGGDISSMVPATIIPYLKGKI
ncbi:pantetheine-phosphate adenylyltransferase [Sphingobacteriaceae bacterium WQ 2009]|uniref:Phosphopantetheine adenylyltransferase n=1 Tax=Rhinopithecimicrobium faecis TaxID=2820698 RepID=A0A8T4HA01_9SPHI|nr:pantetheine-phosphate adenylyltransferase [Sphingobacteriaceae bacterium WQ 2009]